MERNFRKNSSSSISFSFILLAVFFFIERLGDYGVVGLENNTINVALFKLTFQSSQLDNSSLSDFAVDDNLTTCSATAKEKGSTWTVDLGSEYPISHMIINTGKTYFGANFEVWTNNKVSSDGGTLCRYGSNDVLDEYLFYCFQPVSARAVTIKNTFSGSILLCDVQVFVCADGFFGVNCTKECHCDKGELCDKVSGKCPELCAPGWNGTDCQSVCANGRFGPSCNKVCHCLNSTSCNIQTGDCPFGCANNWVGPACQTAIPQLKTSPMLYRAEMTEITIHFYSWISHIDPSITLLYRVQYKLSSDIHGNQSWIKGPLVHDTERFNEEVPVKGLERNSFYIFRVIPILRLNVQEEIEGVASPESIPFRTKCSVPETPNITNAYSWLDTSRRTPVAVLSVEWMPLTAKQSNCENILYYEVFYQKRGSDWKNTGAKRTEHAKNISSDLSFSSEYLVRVVAHNNHPYQSSSDTRLVLTPQSPEVHVEKPPGQDIAILAGILVCLGVVLALVLAVIVYRQKKKLKYEKMQHNAAGREDGLLRNMIIYPDHIYDDVCPNPIILPGDDIPKKKIKRARKRPPIKVEDLESYIKSKKEKSTDCDSALITLLCVHG